MRGSNYSFNEFTPLCDDWFCLRSKALDTDQSFEYTFATAGDFDYFCGLHPHMKGKIIVTPE